MKRIASSLLVLVSLTAQAYRPTSELRIDLSAHPRGTVVILNGNTYPANNGLEVVSGLMPGNYSLVVVRPTYHGRQMIFNGRVNVPAASQVVAFVGQRNSLRVQTFPLAYNNGPSYWDQPNCSQPVSYNQPVCGTVAHFGMSPDVFNRAHATIARLSFDSDRLNMAKMVVRDNGATANQVAQLMGLLSFESSRLDLAKFAYAHTADQQNYFVVYDQFSFSSSVRELQRHIGYY